MAEEIRKHPLNVPGRYYVDWDTCAYNNCCVETAPNNFKLQDDYLAPYVFKQPGTPEEEALCRQASEECPTAAIHDDGEG